MSNLCKYAIIRFVPFSETEEFANVGILLFSPKLGFVDFKLAPTRFARVTDFFDDIDGVLYKNALESFAEELERVKSFGRTMRAKQQVDFFQEVTRFREGVMTFGETSSMLSDDPSTALNTLFNRFVGRSFATKEYREQQMVKLLRQGLKDHVANVSFKHQKLMADYVSVSMPFVACVGHMTKVIKPIAFEHASPLKLIDHGEQWISRVKRLIQTKTIKPEYMMFTVEKPTNQHTDIQKAFEEVSTHMSELNVHVTEFENKQCIYQFASEFSSDEPFELTHS